MENQAFSPQEQEWIARFERDTENLPLPAGYAKHVVSLYKSGLLTMENIDKWRSAPPELERTHGTVTCINGEAAEEFAKTIPDAPDAEVVLAAEVPGIEISEVSPPLLSDE